MHKPASIRDIVNELVAMSLECDLQGIGELDKKAIMIVHEQLQRNPEKTVDQIRSALPRSNILMTPAFLFGGKLYVDATVKLRDDGDYCSKIYGYHEQILSQLYSKEHK